MNELDKTAYDIVQLLAEKNLRIALAESCTGGMAASIITGVPGSSAVIDMSMVTYANRAKIKYTDLTEDILDCFGAVSPQCAAAMASGIQKEAGADIGIGITGIAGPDGGSAEKPVGTVYITVTSESKIITKHFIINKPDRNSIRKETVRQALILLTEVITWL